MWVRVNQLSRTYGQGMKTTLERSAGSADSTGYAGSAGSVGSAGAADFVGSAGSARSAGSAGSACCPSSAASAGSAYQMYGWDRLVQPIAQRQRMYMYDINHKNALHWLVQPVDNMCGNDCIEYIKHPVTALTGSACHKRQHGLAGSACHINIYKYTR